MMRNDEFNKKFIVRYHGGIASPLGQSCLEQPSHKSQQITRKGLDTLAWYSLDHGSANLSHPEFGKDGVVSCRSSVGL